MSLCFAKIRFTRCIWTLKKSASLILFELQKYIRMTKKEIKAVVILECAFAHCTRFLQEFGGNLSLREVETVAFRVRPCGSWSKGYWSSLHHPCFRGDNWRPGRSSDFPKDTHGVPNNAVVTGFSSFPLPLSHRLFFTPQLLRCSTTWILVPSPDSKLHQHLSWDRYCW